MGDLKVTALEALGEESDAYVPTLPYSNRLDWTGANKIIAYLVADLDEIWRIRGPYATVIFIGHSAAGVLLRRLFLAGSPRPPDYANEFAFRDDLPASISRDPDAHCWAAKVERIVSRFRFGLPAVAVVVAFVVLATIALLFPCAGCTLDGTTVFANGGWRNSLAFVAAFTIALSFAKWKSSGWRA
jgi:hypothetical protein